MANINPRARGGNSLSATLAARKAREEQLGRQRVVLPKPTPAPVATGGGVVGMAELIATSGSVVWPAGNIAFSYEGVTYSTVRDPNAGSGGGETKVPIESWLTVNGYEITLAPGWYIPVLNMRILWTGLGAPAAFSGPYMNGGWDIAHNDQSIHGKTPYGQSGTGLWQIANYGPTYMGAGTNLHAECLAVGGNPTADSDAGSSAITWNITKLG